MAKIERSKMVTETCNIKITAEEIRAKFKIPEGAKVEVVSTEIVPLDECVIVAEWTETKAPRTRKVKGDAA